MFDIEKPNICECRTNCRHLVHEIAFENGTSRECVYCGLNMKERLVKCPVWIDELKEKARCRCIVEPVERWEQDDWKIIDNVTGEVYDTGYNKGVAHLVDFLNRELGYE